MLKKLFAQNAAQQKTKNCFRLLAPAAFHQAAQPARVETVDCRSNLMAAVHPVCAV